MDSLWMIINPLAGYRWLRGWRERRQSYCTVTINKPKIVIKGLLQNYEINPDSIVSFLGIPYAYPPVGELRFQPPKPLSRKYFRQYSYAWEAYRHREYCIQYNSERRSCEGSEDCLYLDIHIPKIPTRRQNLLPVFVYIHGGGFTYGHSQDVDLNFMVGKQNCVCVTIQYRLGPLGFLNMRTKNCRGNAGLKDQVMALKWIRDNIKPFGGNPENVTICGHSAGGTCVNLHMISPLSKGLFHKAIVMSGGVYCPWGYGGYARRANRAYELMIRQEHFPLKKVVSQHVVFAILKEKKADELLKLNRRIFCIINQMEPRKMTALLKPSVECIRKDAFLPDTVESLMSKAKPVPTIAGMTKQEGYMFYRSRAAKNPISMVTEDEDFSRFLKSNLDWTDDSVRQNLPAVKALYFPNLNELRNQPGEILECLAKLVTDICFRRFYANFGIRNLLKGGSHPFYVYLFDYFSGEQVPNDTSVPDFRPRASEHGDDVKYLLYQEKVLRSLGHKSDDRKCDQVLTVAARMNELWASFCRNREPKCLGVDVKWIPHTEYDPCYLRISEGLEMCNARLNEARWRDFNDICVGAVQSQASQQGTSEEEDDGQTSSSSSHSLESASL